MANVPIVTELTFAELEALVAADGLNEGLQYKVTDKGWLLIATGVDTYSFFGNNYYKKYVAILSANAPDQTIEPGTELIVGERYRIETYGEGDDFSNVGGENVEHSVFYAIGTTPAIFLNSTLKSNGCFIPTILENTLGNIAWIRVPGSGQYGVLNGAFPANKTIPMVSQGSANDGTNSILRINENNIGISNDTIELYEAEISQIFVEIKVYDI